MSKIALIVVSIFLQSSLTGDQCAGGRRRGIQSRAEGAVWYTWHTFMQWWACHCTTCAMCITLRLAHICAVMGMSLHNMRHVYHTAPGTHLCSDGHVTAQHAPCVSHCAWHTFVQWWACHCTTCAMCITLRLAHICAVMGMSLHNMRHVYHTAPGTHLCSDGHVKRGYFHIMICG